jgi:hypothetical protein
MNTKPMVPQNILFYGNDSISIKIITLLNGNELLRSQFIIMNLLDTTKKIPIKILELKTSPVLILNGLDVPILNTNVLEWFMNNPLVKKDTSKHTTNSDELDSVDTLNSQFSSNFSFIDGDGYVDKQIITHSGYSLLDDTNPTNVVPTVSSQQPSNQMPNDPGYQSKKDMSDEISKKMDQFKQLRATELPQKHTPDFIDFTKQNPTFT